MKLRILLLTILSVGAVLGIRFYNGGKIIGDNENNQTPLENAIAMEVDEDTMAFEHRAYGFTLNYPVRFKVSNFREGDGEQILFQSDDGDWFQIYITPWDEEGDITVDRVRDDLPNIVIKDPQRVILGPKQSEGVGPQALIFFSTDPSLGDTREVWFVHAGFLYQITTYKRLDAMVGQILQTLVFE